MYVIYLLPRQKSQIKKCSSKNSVKLEYGFLSSFRKTIPYDNNNNCSMKIKVKSYINFLFIGSIIPFYTYKFVIEKFEGL